MAWAVAALRCPSASACEPYAEVIELGLLRGRNAMAIWQDLVDTNGFAAGYQSVRRFVWKLQGSRTPDNLAAPTLLGYPAIQMAVDLDRISALLREHLSPRQE